MGAKGGCRGVGSAGHDARDSAVYMGSRSGELCACACYFLCVLTVLGMMHENLLFTWAAALVSCVHARVIFCVCLLAVLGMMHENLLFTWAAALTSFVCVLDIMPGDLLSGVCAASY